MVIAATASGSAARQQSPPRRRRLGIGGRVAPRRTASESREYAIDARTVLFGRSVSARFLRSIGSQSLRLRHSASVRSPRLVPASKSRLEATSAHFGKRAASLSPLFADTCGSARATGRMLPARKPRLSSWVPLWCSPKRATDRRWPAATSSRPQADFSGAAISALRYISAFNQATASGSHTVLITMQYYIVVAAAATTIGRGNPVRFTMPRRYQAAPSGRQLRSTLRQSMPSSSIDSFAADSRTEPSFAAGQRQRPRSRRLANRPMPRSSHQITLTRSPRLPRKTNSAPVVRITGKYGLHLRRQPIEAASRYRPVRTPDK